MIDEIENKQLLRQNMLTWRASLSEEEHLKKSERLSDRLISYLQHGIQWKNSNRCIFTYVPYGSEPNIMSALEWMWENEYVVLCPRIINPHQMQLYHVSSRKELVQGRWGLLEPSFATQPFTAYEELDAVWFPGLAFDQTGGRLGYGKGFYDRWWHNCIESHRINEAGFVQKIPVKIGTAFQEQLVEKLPLEQHDVRMDVLITDDEKIQKFL